MSDYTLLLGDALTVLKTLPANSVQTCVTSPPYFGLRSYLHNGHDDKHMEIGTEETPDAYVAKLVDVFREVRRVLRDDATLWLNLGDSMLPSGCEAMIPHRVAMALMEDGWICRQTIIWHKKAPMPESVTNRCTKAHEYVFLLAKSLTYFYDADAIREPLTDWRQDEDGEWQCISGGGTAGKKQKVAAQYPGMAGKTLPGNMAPGKRIVPNAAGRNRRSVWTLGPESYAGAHFATMPTKLVEPCILAGTSAHGCCAACGSPWERVVERTREHGLSDTSFPKTDGLDKQNGHKRLHQRVKAARAAGEPHDNPLGGTVTLGWQATCTCNADVVPCTVLDPFFGSGTVAAVALKHGRRFVGIDLDERNIRLAHDRIGRSQPLLLAVQP